MKKVAFITGMTGQDGPYLAKHLLDLDYKVYGLIKRYSNPNLDNIKFLGIEKDVELLTGDITDSSQMNHLLKSVQPNEFYNLAAQSFVGASWELNKVTTEVNSIGVLNILNAIHQNSPLTKFYQASTSEMFGNHNSNTPLDENSQFKPRSPYGVSKCYAYWMTVCFRESYSLFTTNGILFNHESPLRGKEFVSRKITDGVAKIKLGLESKITLGNIDSGRDWGFAGDYVEAMHAMMQYSTPEDFVICTGKTKSIRDLLVIAFNHIGISNWEKYISIDPRFKRPAELFTLQGSYNNAKTKLNWEPKTSFEDMIKLMVDEDIKRLS